MQVVAIRVDSATLNWKLDVSKEMTSCFTLLGDEVQSGLRQERGLERKAEAMLQETHFKVESHKISNTQPVFILK